MTFLASFYTFLYHHFLQEEIKTVTMLFTYTMHSVLAWIKTPSFLCLRLLTCKRHHSVHNTLCAHNHTIAGGSFYFFLSSLYLSFLLSQLHHHHNHHLFLKVVGSLHSWASYQHSSYLHVTVLHVICHHGSSQSRSRPGKSFTRAAAL